MARCSSATVLVLVLTSILFTNAVDARNRLSKDSDSPVPIVEASPVLAPFQHVRFCLRYPADCKSDPAENGRIELNEEKSKLLERVNQDVNAAINPMVKGHGSDLQEGWTISPAMGDCNDYAVTKRHELLQSGMPAKALRLSVVKTDSGIGHLVLVVVTTKGDLVLDNLTEAIRPWQNTSYHWLKIQSVADARFWYEVKAGNAYASREDQTIRLAHR
jgi:predicted transglutaminase-like cysteine proteinase